MSEVATDSDKRVVGGWYEWGEDGRLIIVIEETTADRELREFAEKIEPYFFRYKQFVLHEVPSMKPDSPSHPNQLRDQGLRFRSIRKALGHSKTGLAERVGLDPIKFSAFEAGIVPPHHLPDGFVSQLAGILYGDFLKVLPNWIIDN